MWIERCPRSMTPAPLWLLRGGATAFSLLRNASLCPPLSVVATVPPYRQQS